MGIGSRLRAAFESGDFEPLRELYAPDALLDGTLPGERLQARGPDEIVGALASRWRGAELSRWEESWFISGVTVEFEGRLGGGLGRGSSCRFAVVASCVSRRTARGRTEPRPASCPTTARLRRRAGWAR